jgi:hypothetical protein
MGRVEFGALVARCVRFARARDSLYYRDVYPSVYGMMEMFKSPLDTIKQRT